MSKFLPAIGGEKLDLNLNSTPSAGANFAAAPVSVPVLDSGAPLKGSVSMDQNESSYGKTIYDSSGKAVGTAGQRNTMFYGLVPSSLKSRTEIEAWKKLKKTDPAAYEKVKQDSLDQWTEKNKGNSYFTDKGGTQAFGLSANAAQSLKDINNVPPQYTYNDTTGGDSGSSGSSESGVATNNYFSIGGQSGQSGQSQTPPVSIPQPSLPPALPPISGINGTNGVNGTNSISPPVLSGSVNQSVQQPSIQPNGVPNDYLNTGGRLYMPNQQQTPQVTTPPLTPPISGGSGTTLYGGVEQNNNTNNNINNVNNNTNNTNNVNNNTTNNNTNNNINNSVNNNVNNNTNNVNNNTSNTTLYGGVDQTAPIQGGVSGSNGTNGVNGINGTNGINGSNGANGTNGTTPPPLSGQLEINATGGYTPPPYTAPPVSQYQQIPIQDIQPPSLNYSQPQDISGVNIPSYNQTNPYQAPQIAQQQNQFQQPYGTTQQGITQQSQTTTPYLQQPYSAPSGPMRIRF